jgi:hypothetical protein
MSTVKKSTVLAGISPIAEGWRLIYPLSSHSQQLFPILYFNKYSHIQLSIVLSPPLHLLKSVTTFKLSLSIMAPVCAKRVLQGIKLSILSFPLFLVV